MDAPRGAEDVEVNEMCSRRERAFTLVEMLVVRAIIAVLVALVLGVIQLARTYSYRATCMSNLRQLVMALKMYDQSWGGPPPMKVAHDTWDKVQPEIKPVLLCPADPFKGEMFIGTAGRKPKNMVRSSYSPFYFLNELAECNGWAPLPDAERIWFDCGWCTGGWASLVAFADGRVKLVDMTQMPYVDYVANLKKLCRGSP